MPTTLDSLPSSWRCLALRGLTRTPRCLHEQARARLRNTNQCSQFPVPVFSALLSTLQRVSPHSQTSLTTSMTAWLKIARPAARSSLEILRGGMNLITSKTEVESKRRPLSAHNLDTFDATPRGGSFPLDECGLNAGCRPSSHANSTATMRPCPRTSTMQSSRLLCMSRRKVSNSVDLALTFWRIFSSWEPNR
jgi:hypothetical protein